MGLVMNFMAVRRSVEEGPPLCAAEELSGLRGPGSTLVSTVAWPFTTLCTTRPYLAWVRPKLRYAVTLVHDVG